SPGTGAVPPGVPAPAGLSALLHGPRTVRRVDGDASAPCPRRPGDSAPRLDDRTHGLGTRDARLAARIAQRDLVLPGAVRVLDAHLADDVGWAGGSDRSDGSAGGLVL